MKYAYYPGCCMHATAQEYDSSWRAVAEALNIELAEMSGWNCCGTVHATNVGRLVSIGLAALNARDVSGAKRLLNDTGAIAYAMSVAAAYAQRAVQSLEPLPASDAKDSLAELAELVVTKET